MKISEICIKRPVLSTVLSLVVILLGVVSWYYLPVRQFPRVEQPVISIITSFEGASPEIVESQITKPLEDAFATIEGIDMLISNSEVENSKVNLYFRPDRSLSEAANDVRDRLQKARAKFPENVGESIIRKTDADALPVIHLALYSEHMPLQQLADYARRSIQNELEVLKGVANVEVHGGGDYRMQIWLDPYKLAAHRITVKDVVDSIKGNNIEKPAGRLEGENREYTITTSASINTPLAFNNLVVKEREKKLIRLSDVGKAEINTEDKQYRVLFNGSPSVGIALTKQSTANPLEIKEQLMQIMPRLQENLPKGVTLAIANDKTLFVEDSIKQVYKTIFEATFLVIVVIFLFLRSLRASVIPLVTIPVSLIGSFALIYFFDFSINTLTLLAMVLSIGLVVDDAIVVLENVYRHLENGQSVFQAAVQGTREISFAVVAMTLTLAAVYLPLALVPGMTGKLFTEFALTLAGSVIISGFVSLTLSPMMCARVLKSDTVDTHHQEGGIQKKVDQWYERWLQRSLNWRFVVVLGGALVALMGVVLYKNLPAELSPPEDQGLITISAEGPLGATIRYVNPYLEQVDSILSKVPEVKSRYTSISPSGSHALNSLTPWSERNRKSVDIIKDIRPQLDDITGVSVKATPGRSFIGGGQSEGSINFVIKTNKTYEELKEVTDRFMMLMIRYKGISNLSADETLDVDAQEFNVAYNRDKLSAVGLDIMTVAQAMEALMGGKTIGRFKRDGQAYEIRVQLENQYRINPQDVSTVYLRGEKDLMIPLAELVKLESRAAAVERRHFQKMRAIRLYGELTPGYGFDTVLNEIKNAADQALPDGFYLDYDGETRRFMQESKSIYLIFFLALAFIYLVLAAQFESFVDPLIIMLSVPLSLTGGLVILALSYFLGSTKMFDLYASINIYSQIGFVTLIGLITKHGILIVDFANKLRDEGFNIKEAVAKSARLRLRPILMTTFAMVLGAVPLAFSGGAGAEARQQIGLVVVGGMSLGTLFTLFVVPVFYTYLTRKERVLDT